jgi:micrococcal nuclease
MTRACPLVLVLLIAFVLALTSCGGSSPPLVDKPPVPPPTQQQEQTEPAPTSDPAQTPQPSPQASAQPPIPLSQVTVTRIVDGDTIYVRLSSGAEEKVRFIGVDTPETRHASKPVESYGPEAEAYTRAQLDGKQVWLELDVQERDRYGRILAYVWLSPPSQIDDWEIRDKMFNARLLLDGYAQLATYPPNVKYVDHFRKYQAEARDGNKGLWGIQETSTPVTAPAQQPAPTVPPSSSPAPTAGDVIVYITDTGTKYHQDGCRHLAKNKILASLSEAKAWGYEPCGVCSPPR